MIQKDKIILRCHFLNVLYEKVFNLKFERKIMIVCIQKIKKIKLN